MALILGIDPGAYTGVAVYVDGVLKTLTTVAPHQIERLIRAHQPDRVVFEDSRLQSHTWSIAPSRAAAAKMARNVGEIDAWCRLITEICAELKIPAHGVSPKGKGAKLNSVQFESVTGWLGTSNEHTRDAAMVAWKYRGAADMRGGARG